jgi:cytochrome c oxidase assembly protein subunit 15
MSVQAARRSSGEATRVGDALAEGGPSDVLALGFGTTVAMWAVGYVGHLPLVRVPTAVLVGLMLACLLSGGWLAGRHTRRGLRGGAWVGLISATLNLLIFGSLLIEPQSGQLVPDAWLWVPGWFGLSVSLAAIGAAVGGRRKAEGGRGTSMPPNWLAGLAWITCAAALLLITAGGLVTGFRAGMAVPDWPNTFGSNMFLYPLSQMTGGVFYEHAHRLLGTLVGSAALVLAICLTAAFPQRRKLVVFTWLVGAAVALQGIFGGLRVVDDSHCLVVVHGFFAHAVFGCLVAIAVMLARDWQQREGARTILFAVLAVAAVLLQTLLGTLVRQLNVGFLTHVTVAVLVVLAAVGAGVQREKGTVPIFVTRKWDCPPCQRGFARAGLVPFFLLLVVVQLNLGIVAAVFRTPPATASPTAEALEAAEGRLPVEPLPALATTAHQATAAVLLGVATLLAVSAWPKESRRGSEQVSR